MSLGTYPYHVRDPWGEPGYPSASAEYDRVITADVRSPMRELQDFNAYPDIVNLIAKLKERGYSDTDVRKILGENLMRVFDQVWV